MILKAVIRGNLSANKPYARAFATEAIMNPHNRYWNIITIIVIGCFLLNLVIPPDSIMSLRVSFSRSGVLGGTIASQPILTAHLAIHLQYL